MVKFIKELLISYGISEPLSLNISNWCSIIIIFVISYLADLIISKVFLKLIKEYSAKTKAKWSDILIEKKVFNCAVHIIPFLIIYTFAPLFPQYQNWIERFTAILIIIIVLISVDKLFDAINEIYKGFEVSKIRPIKGYLQVIQIVLYVISSIIIISTIINKNPVILLSGIGAATAVLMLVFQNSILGLVASLQISANKMLQIDDWIEMPKYGADGVVLEITLHTVKVQNFDKTITTIPTHLLITDSFKNWRGMQESGSRRIKRSIFIDVNSIKLCKYEELKKICNVSFINQYIQEEEYRKEKHYRYNKLDNYNKLEERQCTNIGIFRCYLENYLINHPDIINEMTPTVRQLQLTEKGLPIEIYAFTNKIQWKEYEEIQAEIFEHILAVINEFGLRIYQEPSGYDFNNYNNHLKIN